MVNLSTWGMALRLLDAHERGEALKLLLVAAFSALMEMTMVGSVLPFLTILMDPASIATNPRLDAIYRFFEFETEYAFVVAAGILSLFCILIASGSVVLRTSMTIRFSLARQHSFSVKLLRVLLSQKYPFFLDRNSGELSKIVLDETIHLVNGFILPALKLVTASMTILALVILLFWVDSLVAVAAFGLFGGAYALIYLANTALLGRLGEKRVTANTDRYKVVNEAFGGIKDIKILGREKFYVDRYTSPSSAMAESTASMRLLSEIPGHVIRALVFVSVIVLCLLLIDRGSFSDGQLITTLVPTLAVFALAGQRLLPALTQAYNAITAIRFGSPAVKVVHDALLLGTGRLAEESGESEPFRMKRELTLKNVSFTYPASRLPSLSDIDLTIHRGERIGLVGGTGAGKTTLADIALGLIRPSVGEVLVDGAALAPQDMRSWRRLVGYVQQDIFLADTSVWQNIALGVPHAEIDMAHVRHCALLAKIDHFVRNELPEGFDTNVGERGVRLSGGQRQRVGIARALYHNADIIVFDEATSALDNLTERDVIESIESLPGEKTIIVIAHRLSTVRHCDRIVVLEGGRVVGCGAWESLAENNAAFRQLVQKSEVVQ